MMNELLSEEVAKQREEITMLKLKIQKIESLLEAFTKILQIHQESK